MRNLSRWVSLVVGIGAAVIIVRGCQSVQSEDAPTAEQVDAAADLDSAGHVGFDGFPDVASEHDATDGASGCAPRSIPPDVPSGWVEYPIMDCKYRLYVPPTADQLPEGLTWEPCTKNLGPDSFDCRQVKVTWPLVDEVIYGIPYGPPYGFGGVSPGYVEDDGRVVLQLCELHRRKQSGGEIETGCMGLVVEADGPVRQAFWMNYTTGQFPPMSLSNVSVAPTKSTWVAVEWVETDGNHEVDRYVPIGGDDTDIFPPILWDHSADAPDAAIAYAGRNYYLEQSTVLKVHGWDGTDYGVVASPTVALSPAEWVGDTLLWAYESGFTYRLWTWTKQDGSRELTPFGADQTKGAGNPGSDGKDLVWLQGDNLGPNDETWPTRSVMTAPFTTDPAKLQPRRLRSWAVPALAALRPPAVGCGYAAFLYFTEPTAQPSLLIVRLSDGVSWILHGPPDPGPHWDSPVAMTCDEVFSIFVGMGGFQSLRRIRLDSLGPGTPPD